MDILRTLSNVLKYQIALWLLIITLFLLFTGILFSMVFTIQDTYNVGLNGVCFGGWLVTTMFRLHIIPPLLSPFPLLSSPCQCHQCQSYWILGVYNVIIRCENGDTMEQWGLGRHSPPLVPSHTLPVCYQDTHVHTHSVACWKDVQHALEFT